MIVDTVRCQWTFRNVRFLGSEVWSRHFGSKSKDFLCALGIAQMPPRSFHQPDRLLVQLYFDSDSNGFTAVKYEVSILGGQNHEKVFTKVFTWNYIDSDTNITSFIDYDQLLDRANGYLQRNGDLTLVCEVYFLDETMPDLQMNDNNNNKPTTIMPTTSPSPPPLLANYKSLLDSGDHSDVQLVVGERSFPSHRLILSAQSPVFGAMFGQSECKESLEGRVEITDLSPEVVGLMLDYIYSGQVPPSKSMQEHGLELFVAADKYGLDHLKAAAEHWLAASLSVETVAEVVQLADRHQAQGLKSASIEFIATNASGVMALPSWQHLQTNQPQLMGEVFASLVSEFNFVKKKRKLED